MMETAIKNTSGAEVVKQFVSPCKSLVNFLKTPFGRIIALVLCLCALTEFTNTNSSATQGTILFADKKRISDEQVYKYINALYWYTNLQALSFGNSSYNNVRANNSIRNNYEEDEAKIQRIQRKIFANEPLTVEEHTWLDQNLYRLMGKGHCGKLLTMIMVNARTNMLLQVRNKILKLIGFEEGQSKIGVMVNFRKDINYQENPTFGILGRIDDIKVYDLMRHPFFHPDIDHMMDSVRANSGYMLYFEVVTNGGPSYFDDKPNVLHIMLKDIYSNNQFTRDAVGIGGSVLERFCWSREFIRDFSRVIFSPSTQELHFTCRQSSSQADELLISYSLGKEKIVVASIGNGFILDATNKLIEIFSSQKTERVFSGYKANTESTEKFTSSQRGRESLN